MSGFLSFCAVLAHVVSCDFFWVCFHCRVVDVKMQQHQKKIFLDLPTRCVLAFWGEVKEHFFSFSFVPSEFKALFFGFVMMWQLLCGTKIAW